MDTEKKTGKFAETVKYVLEICGIIITAILSVISQIF